LIALIRNERAGKQEEVMGREIRKVPPNWDHPKQEGAYDDRLQPMYDSTFAEAAAEWKAEYEKWEAGERPSYCTAEHATLEYWEYDSSPPDRDYYRPWQDDEATWFQVWETVSEGTPVTPPFATRAELVDYLATHGDFWDQKRGDGPWPRSAAEKFVGDGWAPTMVAVVTPTGSSVIGPRDEAMYDHH
jgi:hypothetical protein